MLDGNPDCLEAKALADLILPKPRVQFNRDKADIAHYLYRVLYNGRLLIGMESANIRIVDAFLLASRYSTTQ